METNTQIDKKSGLKEYAKFLKENYLRELTIANINLARKEKLPLLRFFEGLSEEQLINTGIEGLRKFFESVENGRALEETIKSLNDWKENKVPGIPREEVQIPDLVLVHANRDKNIRSFLPRFTSDVEVAMQITEELDDLRVEYNKRAFATFVEIQKEVLEKKNLLIVENEAKLNEAQEIGLIGSWEFIVEENKVIWSDQMYRLFGYVPGEVAIDYEKYQAHLHPADRKVISEKVAAAIQSQSPYTVEHRIITKDNKVKWLLGRGKAVEVKGGKVLKIAGTAQDITEEKQYQETLEKRQESLTAVNKELEAFCYTISHDLRSPLRAIDGFGKMLYEDYAEVLDKEGFRILEVIRNNAKFMGALIDDLLEFSRLNRKDIVVNQVDMKQMALSVYEELKQSCPESKASFLVQELPTAIGDKNMIHQVWQNLIGNALKFTMKKENPEVVVGFKREKGEVVYFVKDNGAGFDMKYSNKLFGVFQRLHNMEEFAGTGVGLATVKRIILRNGGSVWGEGKVNEGATFYFTLPSK